MMNIPSYTLGGFWPMGLLILYGTWTRLGFSLSVLNKLRHASAKCRQCSHARNNGTEFAIQLLTPTVTISIHRLVREQRKTFADVLGIVDDGVLNSDIWRLVIFSKMLVDHVKWLHHCGLAVFAATLDETVGKALFFHAVVALSPVLVPADVSYEFG